MEDVTARPGRCLRGLEGSISIGIRPHGAARYLHTIYLSVWSYAFNML